jgi:metal-responsive CopG/Arc/MetJ family transcriptional regulator
MIHTESMKIAISVPEELCREVDLIARKAKMSRSRVFTIAVREQLKALENRCLFESLNASAAVPDTTDESQARRVFQGLYFRDIGKKDRYED